MARTIDGKSLEIGMEVFHADTGESGTVTIVFRDGARVRFLHFPENVYRTENVPESKLTTRQMISEKIRLFGFEC